VKYFKLIACRNSESAFHSCCRDCGGMADVRERLRRLLIRASACACVRNHQSTTPRRRLVDTKFRRSSRPASSSSSDTSGSLDWRRCSQNRAPDGAAGSGHYFAPGRPPPGHAPPPGYLYLNVKMS